MYENALYWLTRIAYWRNEVERLREREAHAMGAMRRFYALHADDASEQVIKCIRLYWINASL